MIFAFLRYLIVPPFARPPLWILTILLVVAPERLIVFLLTSWVSFATSAVTLLIGALKPRFLEEMFGRIFGKYIFQSDAIRGIWLSEYKYKSSPDRRRILSSSHYAEIRSFRSKVYVRSLPRGDGSLFRINLERNGNLLTGNWEESTSSGNVYFGAIQMVIVPTEKEIRGLWVGYTRSFGIQAGPWTLKQVAATASKAAQAHHIEQGRLLK